MTVIGPVLLEQSADTPVYHPTVRRHPVQKAATLAVRQHDTIVGTR